MNPHFFHFGTLFLPPYFTMLSVGLLLAVFLARRWARRHDLDAGRMLDFGILMVVLGVIGAKLLHVLADGYFWDYVHLCTDPSQVNWRVDPPECRALGGVWDNAQNTCHPAAKNCLAWASGSGFAYYGGLLFAGLFSVWFIRRHKWPAAKICDMGGWTIPLGLAWGRMGCFLSGCCFGAPTAHGSGIVFPAGSSAARAQWEAGLLSTYRIPSLPVHPTQVYESVASLIIAALAYFVVRQRKTFDGQVFVFSMISYGAVRFGLECIRQDERGEWLGLSTSQWLAVVIVGVCIPLYVYFRRKATTGAAHRERLV
ncbi:MAG: prolipoprotein diacylglyceryl transferase [Proteobacteria bacterium]|nr:prolipoprotein diacylglyceryl transferase [Pseudomonadota bacterium]